MTKPAQTPQDLAQAYGLVYYTDDNPGIRRRRCGRGFTYVDPKGARITDPAERQRLAAMAVPPAYDDVWMAPTEACHLWATGIDEAGRKQYRYNPIWTDATSEAKFDTLARVVDHLPRLRRWIAARLKGDPKDKDTQVAAALAFIDRAALRPGHETYAETNQSYGAVTLEDRHVTVEGDRIDLSFRGKGGVRVTETLHGSQLASAVADMADAPGARLFTYEGPSGTPHVLRPAHLTDTLQTVTDGQLTPKTLRTWHGSLAAFSALRDGTADTVTGLCEQAAARLHNTPAVARASYIHPRILDAATDRAARDRLAALSDDGPSGLRKHEAAMARLFQANLR